MKFGRFANLKKKRFCPPHPGSRSWKSREQPRFQPPWGSPGRREQFMASQGFNERNCRCRMSHFNQPTTQLINHTIPMQFCLVPSWCIESTPKYAPRISNSGCDSKWRFWNPDFFSLKSQHGLKLACNISTPLTTLVDHTHKRTPFGQGASNKSKTNQ